MIDPNVQFTEALLGAKSYRDFLAMFFSKDHGASVGQTHRRTLSYAEFSRRAGFSSRSYIRDILLGKKRVNLSNFEKIAVGLKLTSHQREFFRALVTLEEPGFRVRTTLGPEAILAKQILKIRKSCRLKRLSKDKLDVKGLLDSAEVALVFASTGTEIQGASHDEIEGRCKLGQTLVKNALQALIRSDLVSARDGRFFPCSAHVAFERLGGDEFFRHDFLRTVASLKRKFENQPNQSTSLFLASTFCVCESQLPALKESLSQVLFHFISGAEDSQGDTVVELVVGLTPPIQSTARQ
ncbi:MAG: hypothetical protein JNM39_18225 [Bdellovibrionaceae bacterium]|nr:hypothetical protein [Pseudobdellovibrionaceae bacterium]